MARTKKSERNKKIKTSKAVYPDYKPFNPDLTLEQADYIRNWRCNQGYTWRGVARLAAETFPELNVCNGNQIDGMELCKDAMVLLGEYEDKHNWN